MTKEFMEFAKLVMKAMYEYDSPTDCGNPRRWEFDDVGRSESEKGVGKCDYDCGCDWFADGKCPFQKKEEN